MNYQDIEERMVTICTTDLWNVNPIISRPAPSFCKEDDYVDVQVTAGDNKFLMDQTM